MLFDLSRLVKIIPPSFYPLLRDKSRFLLLKGGAGSGKSHTAIIKTLVRILVGYKTNTIHKFLLLRKTQPAARKSVFALLLHYINMWNLDSLLNVNNTDMTVTFSNGSQILTTGLDNVDKLKSIEGITSVILEEATEFTIADFRQINLRLRGITKSYKQIILCFNPISKKSWVYKEFFSADKNNTTIHNSTYKDNPYLDKEYVEELENLVNQDVAYYKIYTLGEWGVLENLIFHNWDIVDEIPDRYTKSEHVYGLDWGFTHPTCLLAIVKDGDDIYLDEMLYQSGLTNMDVLGWVKDNIQQGRIYADSAEPARLKEFRKHGINIIPATKGKNSVKDSIDFVKRYKLHITKQSNNLIKEIETYKYRQTRDGEVLEEPVDFNDDAIAAMRYGIYSHWGRAAQYTQLIT